PNDPERTQGERPRVRPRLHPARRFELDPVAVPEYDECVQQDRAGVEPPRTELDRPQAVDEPAQLGEVVPHQRQTQPRRFELLEVLGIDLAAAGLEPAGLVRITGVEARERTVEQRREVARAGSGGVRLDGGSRAGAERPHVAPAPCERIYAEV